MKNNALSLLTLPKCDHIIFASSAAIYGEGIFLTEESPVNPLSPYGDSKLSAELLIKNMFEKYTIFRLFNVAGGGPFHDKNNRLLTLAKHNKTINLYGNTYGTVDGSAVRSYIHPIDVANAMVNTYEWQDIGTYNLGVHIRSNKEILSHYGTVYNLKDAREGEPAFLTNASDKYEWPSFYTLKSMREILDSH